MKTTVYERDHAHIVLHDHVMEDKVWMRVAYVTPLEGSPLQSPTMMVVSMMRPDDGRGNIQFAYLTGDCHAPQWRKMEPMVMLYLAHRGVFERPDDEDNLPDDLADQLRDLL